MIAAARGVQRGRGPFGLFGHFQRCEAMRKENALIGYAFCKKARARSGRWVGDGAAAVSVRRGADEREPTACKPAAPVRPSGSSINPEGRTRAEGLLLCQSVLVAEAFGKRRHVAADLFIGDLRVDLGGLDIRMP